MTLWTKLANVKTNLKPGKHFKQVILHMTRDRYSLCTMTSRTVFIYLNSTLASAPGPKYIKVFSRNKTQLHAETSNFLGFWLLFKRV